MAYVCQFRNGGSAPATPGFIAVAPEWLFEGGTACAAPAIPAAESTLGSHPCVALSSAQVFPEWSNRNLAGNTFPANGDYPLNFVSHSMGSLQFLAAAGYFCFCSVARRLGWSGPRSATNSGTFSAAFNQPKNKGP